MAGNLGIGRAVRLAVVVLVAVLFVGCSGSDRNAGTHGRSIHLASDLFGETPDHGGSYERIRVSGDFDQAAVTGALGRAGVRLSLTDSAGVEHPDEDSAEEAFDDDHYTPNFVDDPKVTSEGVELYVDCKGAIEPPMAEAFRRIVGQELDVPGVRAVVVTNVPLNDR